MMNATFKNEGNWRETPVRMGTNTQVPVVTARFYFPFTMLYEQEGVNVFDSFYGERLLHRDPSHIDGLSGYDLADLLGLFHLLELRIKAQE